MNAFRVGLAALVALAAGCKDKKADDKGDAPVETARTPDARPAPRPARPDATPPEPAIVALELPTIGSRDKPIVIQVPEGTEVQMQDVESDEMLPWAKLQAGLLDITVESPEGGMSSLEQEKGMISRGDSGARFLHEAKTDGGWEMVVQRGDKFSANVQHTRLNIACGSGDLPDRATADKILAICKTITEKK